MSDLRIGWACRDISTTRPVKLAGQFHVRVSKGIAEPIYATALALDSGDDYVIFVSLDLISIGNYIVDDVRAAVTRRMPEIDPLKITFNATHTHTAPSTYKESAITLSQPNTGIEIAPNSEYRDYLIPLVADAICSAWENRSEGQIGYGYGYAVVAHSRRVIYFDDVSKRPDAKDKSGLAVDGHGVMYGNTDDPNFSHYEAGADHFINLLFTFDPAGKLTGAVVNIPCPSQNSEMEYKISADYWADVRQAIRAKHGDIFILPQCAAAGDLSPRILHYKAAEARRFRLKYGDRAENYERAARKDIAERVAAAFDEVLDWAKLDLHGSAPITHITEIVDLDRRWVTEEEYALATNTLESLKDVAYETEGADPEELARRNSILTTRRNRSNRILEKWEAQQSVGTFDIELHVVRVGDIAFATNPFEMYKDYKHRIQARSPFEQTFIVQMSPRPGEGGGAYLPTERGLSNCGYSASLYDNRVSPKGGQQLVDRTVELLKQIK